jgi:hypothetical protein
MQKLLCGGILMFIVMTLGVHAQYVVNFEGAGETKTGYGSTNVNLSGLSWNLTEALIGTADADFKNGARSARFRGYATSSMTMLEDLSAGIGTIAFVYRRYGTDTQVPHVVEYSIDQGASWIQAGEEFTAPASTEVQTFFETVNVEDPARIRIRSITDNTTSNRRFNIDDITITAFGVSGFSASLDKSDGFVVPEGIQQIITASAIGGAEPYDFEWSSSLGSTHFTASGNEFTILASAPVGDYSVTVTVTDNDSEEANSSISFSVVPQYAINISTANGTVTTSPEGTAIAGATVTITATPNTGYVLGEISVVGADSEPIDLTGNTFTMPAQAVTVSVTFEEISAPPGLLAWFVASSANTNALVQPPAFLETGLSLDDDGITGTGPANVLLKTPTTIWSNELHYAHVAGTGAYAGERGDNGFVLTINALEGATFSLSSISFRHRATSTGPGLVGVKVNGVEFAGTGSAVTTAIGTYESEDLGLAELTQAIIYIQGWNSPGTGNGEFQINDIRIAGVVDGEGPGPDPEQAEITGFTRSGADFVITFTGEVGATYQLEYTADLTNPESWIGGPQGSSGSLTDVAPDAPVRFYRLIDLGDN